MTPWRLPRDAALAVFNGYPLLVSIPCYNQDRSSMPVLGALNYFMQYRVEISDGASPVSTSTRRCAARTTPPIPRRPFVFQESYCLCSSSSSFISFSFPPSSSSLIYTFSRGILAALTGTGTHSKLISILS